MAYETKCAAGSIFLSESWWVVWPVDEVGKFVFTNQDLTCKRGSVGQSKGQLIPRSSV